jgi:hypothetical protein
LAKCLWSDSQKVFISQGCSCYRQRTWWPRERGLEPAGAGPAGFWPTRCCTTQPCRPSGRRPCQVPGPMVPRPEGEEGQGPCLVCCSAYHGPHPCTPRITPATEPLLAAAALPGFISSDPQDQSPSEQLGAGVTVAGWQSIHSVSLGRALVYLGHSSAIEGSGESNWWARLGLGAGGAKGSRPSLSPPWLCHYPVGPHGGLS